MEKERTYIAIDLKSFYASVECRERGLDPLTTNLVVADPSRTEKTICLAVSPSLKSYGIPGRPRLFEVIQRVREVNARRKALAGGKLRGESYDATRLQSCPELAVSFVTAPPRMAFYIEYSTKIYHIYLKYVAPEDIHVYSIDEVFVDVTDYLSVYKMSAHELALTMVRDVFDQTGITATVGIGTNLYLAKVAMDIVAKHMPPGADGGRTAELDEMSYRRLLWSHRPLTDFWRVGRGYADKLAAYGIFTMGDVARCSLDNEGLLYRLFGVNAELLIDHAWGWEPCTIADIKAYRPQENSICAGQVLKCPYTFEKARLVVREMADLMALDLVDKKLVTDQFTLTVGYDAVNMADPNIRKQYSDSATVDRYGRETPKHAHGTANLPHRTSSAKAITEAITALYDRIVDPGLLVRRLTLVACRVIRESQASAEPVYEQLDLFSDVQALEERQKQEEQALEREKRRQQTVLDIRKRFGKNALIKGMSLEEGATMRERNDQIGGHKA